MYSIVLMMALTSGAEAPDCHKHSCGGGSCGGYVVYSCGGGCTGSSCHGGHGLFGGHKHSCHGGCTGTAYYGGCTGYAYSGGCTGYAYGGGCYGGYAGYAGCSGGMYYGPGGMMMMPEGKPPEKIETKPKEKKEKDEVAAPATITVSLPADAQLTVDGAATASTSAVRTFVTPVLAPEKEFVYTLTAKVVRDGETLTLTEKVSVTAGAESRVTFGAEKFTTTTVAAK